MSDEKKKTLLSEQLPAREPREDGSPRARTLAHMRKLMAAAVLASSTCTKPSDPPEVPPTPEPPPPTRTGSGYEVVDMLPPPAPRPPEWAHPPVSDVDAPPFVITVTPKARIRTTDREIGHRAGPLVVKGVKRGELLMIGDDAKLLVLLRPGVDDAGALTVQFDSSPWSILTVDGVSQGRTPRPPISVRGSKTFEIVSERQEPIRMVIRPAAAGDLKR